MPPCASIKIDGGPVTRLAGIPDVDKQIVVASAASIQTIQLTENGSLAGDLQSNHSKSSLRAHL